MTKPKYEVGQEVWVSFMGEIQKAIVDDKYVTITYLLKQNKKSKGFFCKTPENIYSTKQAAEEALR